MKNLVNKKYYCNPCIPYNIGFKASTGDKIIIQNPECCHMGDVLSYTDQHLTDDVYLSYHAYGCTKQDLKFLHADEPVPMFSHSKKARWYNHETERPVAFHFCNAITRNNLIKINGFDEAYSTGHNYDDAEILHRIRNLGLQIKFVADPWVIHQYHPKSYGHPDNPQPTTDNRVLYEALLTSNQIRANNETQI
jgi:GT2 family glycosyltransferase